MRTYANPIAREGDFADPFVLRFNGRYYLYCTNPDLRCWSSPDLLDWTLEGPTIAAGTFGDLVPFAPEVTYDNGAFHLYTSPSGTGHRILRSDRPTGPFVPVTPNLGHAIDGHVFTDDDGRRYFYWAGDEGIWGCEMASPTDLGEPVLTGAFMHGWTEGPFVVKREGRYHMTLTGNHYLSPGYRINAAVSDHPLHGYRDSPLNPILVSTAPDHLGLGHSSSVLGPDLVSTHLVYHNLNPDRTRDLNIDRQVWHGDLLEILGPSRLAVAPAGPDHGTAWGADESRRWTVARGSLAEQAEVAHLEGPGEVSWRDGRLADCFTSEHTISATADSYGILARDGERVGWRLEVESATNQLRVLAGGATRPLAAGGLPPGHRHDVLHCYRLVGYDGRVEIFLDDRRILQFRPEQIAGLRLGYHCGDGTLTVGYTALTRNVEQYADRTASRPVPGRFLPASADRAGDGPSRSDCIVGPAAEFRQALLVAASSEYDLRLTGDFPAGATVEVAIDDEVWELELPQATTAIHARPALTAGTHTLTVSSGHLPVTLREVSLVAAAPPPVEGARPQVCSGTGKLLTSLPTVADWELTATVTVDFRGSGAHADLLLCAGDLAEGGEGDDTLLGIDFLLGYSLQFHRHRIVLARHAYDEREAAQLVATVAAGVPHPVTITRCGSTLTALVAGFDPLVLDDPWPHPGGRLGLRTRDASITVTSVDLVASAWTRLRRVRDSVLASQTPGQPSR